MAGAEGVMWRGVADENGQEAIRGQSYGALWVTVGASASTLSDIDGSH